MIGNGGKVKRTAANFTSIVTSLNDDSNNINIRVTKTPNHTTQDTEDQYISGGSRPSHKGRPGHPHPDGGGRSQNRFFSAFRASVWSKNKGRRAPSLDPPLKMIYARIRTDPVCQFSNLSRVTGTELGMYSADPQ